jgi:hypothetical protein
MAAGPSGRTITTSPFNTTFTVQDSQLRGVYWHFNNWSSSGCTTPNIISKNNLFERCTLAWTQGYDISPFNPYYLYFTFRNNLCRRSTVTLIHYNAYYGNWDLYDNLFDNCTLSLTEKGGSPLATVGYNGYTGFAAFGGSNNKTSLLTDYRKGPFGNYYYPATGPANSLATLIGAGNRTVAAAGLAQHTVRLDQAVDVDDPKVDIGFHYVASDGLVGHWRFDEGLGTIASDVSAHSNHGVLLSNPTWTTGKYGGALNFALSDQRVGVPNNAALSFSTGNFTIALWVAPSSGGSAIAKGSGGTPAADTEYVLYINGSPNNQFYFRGSWWNSSALRNIPANGTWTHVAVVYTASDQTLRFYKDGVFVDSTVVSGSYASDTSKPFFIGTQGSLLSNDYGGKLDDVQIYAQALTATQITALFSNPGWNSTLDADGDGLANYAEDRDGDTVLDAGETNWLISNSGIEATSGLQVYTPLDN